MSKQKINYLDIAQEYLLYIAIVISYLSVIANTIIQTVHEPRTTQIAVSLSVAIILSMLIMYVNSSKPPL